jgi:hypothetical protein
VNSDGSNVSEAIPILFKYKIGYCTEIGFTWNVYVCAAVICIDVQGNS